MFNRTLSRVDRLLAELPLYPFLFAVAAILPLWATNFGEAPTAEMAALIAVVLAVTAAGFAVAWAAYRDARRGAIVTAAGAALALKLGQVDTMLGILWDVHPAVVLIGASALLAIVAAAAAKARPALMAPLTQAANVASVLLLVWVGAPLAGFIDDTLSGPPDVRLAELPPTAGAASTSGTTLGSRRDIYYIVLDRYGSERAFEVGFGIDNSDFIGWLRERGFDVADDARANFVSTPLSLGTSLAMRGIDDIAAQVGPDYRTLAPVVERVRNSRVGAFLQGQGYDYVHLGSWFDPTRVSAIADRAYAPRGHQSLATVATDSSVLGVALRWLDPGWSYDAMHADAAEYAFDLLDRLLDEPGPKFVVAHILMPHPPYVFLEDGTFAPGSATLESQLHYTNSRVADFVSRALRSPESEQPIVILQADEGPYPARYELDTNGFDWADATDAEIEVKFGILSALYLPGDAGIEPLPSTLSPVNTFREVLRRYFGIALEILPDQSFASPYLRPYALTDVTARLSGPATTAVTDDSGG